MSHVTKPNPTGAVVSYKNRSHEQKKSSVFTRDKLPRVTVLVPICGNSSIHRLAASLRLGQS